MEGFWISFSFFPLLSYPVRSQIWLNNLMDDHHITYITKLKKQKENKKTKKQWFTDFSG
jgi:hypothetical protein